MICVCMPLMCTHTHLFPDVLYVSKFENLIQLKPLYACLLLHWRGIVLYEYHRVWHCTTLQTTVYNCLLIPRILSPWVHCCLILTSSKLADPLWEVLGITEVCFCDGGFIGRGMQYVCWIKLVFFIFTFIAYVNDKW